MEIARRCDALLQVLTDRRRHADQVLRAGASDSRQFGHERLGLIDVLQHFHAHDFACAAVGQGQRQAVADQPQRHARVWAETCRARSRSLLNSLSVKITEAP